jgi:hypothetical protein
MEIALYVKNISRAKTLESSKSFFGRVGFPKKKEGEIKG